MAESQCRELDSAVTNVRRECSELRKIEAKLRKEVPKTAGGNDSMKHIRGELEVLRAQNLALRKTQIVHRSTLCTSAHPFQKFPHRLPKSLIVEHVKLGRCDPTTRAALIAALRLENQDLKLLIGEREGEIARLKPESAHSDVCYHSNHGYAKTELKILVDGLQLVMQRQGLHIRMLRNYAGL